MLLVWKLPVTRPTRDIDLLGRQVGNDLENVRAVVSSICWTAVAEDDGMLFDYASVAVSRIAEDADCQGVRATFGAALGNVRLPMQIDIGFSDRVTPAPVSTAYPTLLGHAVPELLAYNRETAVAEKFEAMVKLGELNSRMKDFFDVWMLARTGSFQGEELSQAIAQTFWRRGTALSTDPIGFDEAFAASAAKAVQWQAFVRRGRFADPVPAFAEVVEAVAGFLRPVCLALQDGRAWTVAWPPGGPWRL